MNGRGRRRGRPLLYAARLPCTASADWIVCAAGRAELSFTERPQAEAMQELLGWMNVDESRIILDTKSRNTRENAAESLPLAVAHGAKRVFLVTSASHMPRSIRIFRKQAEQLRIGDLEIIPAPCDYAFIDPERYPAWYYRFAIWMLPTSGSLEISTRSLHEYYGMAYYWLRGWI